ncbi:MAG: oligoribonuclease [Gammaproteobacteria bacterium]|nr:oligoribonuclease [Gammaproteobacteria bacterium]
MPKDPNALVWIDMEMTGLDPERDRIIEIATIITDTDLNLIAEGPVIAIHQLDSVLEGMDEWNTKTHNETGLVTRVRTSAHDEREAEMETLRFIKAYVPKNRSPLCGNSICQDRRFLARHMPQLEHWLHYRNLDVSSLKELARRWAPKIYEGVVKRNTHKALDDIRESIDELRYYREHFIVLDRGEAPDEPGST